MERIPYGKYSKEFRQEAVKLVIEGGLSIPEAGRLAEVGSKQRPLTEIECISKRILRMA